MDLQKFYTGTCFDAYEYFGAHPEKGGVTFRTYAPNAQSVRVMGEFTGWQEQPMTRCRGSGVWTLFSPWAAPGQLYKFVIYSPSGRREHCDPYGFGMELRPGSCSVIRDLRSYKFTDRKWMKNRTRCFDKPLNIYELHLGSWKKNGWQWLTYDTIADQLIPYLKERHYTHVEFMPLSEHPFDGSWGYQSTGFFAPTSRYGSAHQLMSLIDRLHQANIGAIADFVPVHFALDSYGLREYDGTALYEYPPDTFGISEWGSCNFCHARPETASFLQSAANYWLKEYHFDGLRFDAVSRMLYWQGDPQRGENKASIQFLKQINQGLHRLHPTAMLIAEDSTVYPGVTAAVESGGLGFDYKWDMGWTYDTLHYFRHHSWDRGQMPDKIRFSFYYAAQERYILPFSHDEAARGRKTVISRLYGTREEQFSQARLLYLYMMTHPGKKLNFMGSELAAFREWDVKRETDWGLLQKNDHAAFHRFVTDLNRLYRKQNALWEQDQNPDSLIWMNCGTDNSCVFGYARRCHTGDLLVLLNFSDREVPISPDWRGNFTLLLHTGQRIYGGKTRKCPQNALPTSLPPYTGMLYSCTYP